MNKLKLFLLIVFDAKFLLSLVVIYTHFNFWILENKFATISQNKWCNPFIPFTKIIYKFLFQINPIKLPKTLEKVVNKK